MGLKDIREAQGWSIRELSELSGVSTVTIWKLENRKCKARPSTKRALAKALKTKPNEIRE